MKTYFKITLLAAALVGCATLANAQVNFGVKAGLNLANMFVDPTPDTKPKMLITFQVGGVVDIPITKNFVIQPGLMLVGKGAKSEESGVVEGVTYSYTAKIAPYYLQVPVMFMYQGKRFYAGVGPYAGFGLFGKEEAKLVVDGMTLFGESAALKFGNTEDDHLAPLDFGAQIEAGVALSGGLRLGAGYSLGLANIIPGDSRDDNSVKHGVISVNVAYMFGGGK